MPNRADSLISLGARQRLFAELSPLMEEWSGQKLKPTSCYGVRHYFRGSVLANHVDRVDTHVISGIINVAQVHSAPTPPSRIHTPHDFVSEKRTFFRRLGEVSKIFRGRYKRIISYIRRRFSCCAGGGRLCLRNKNWRGMAGKSRRQLVFYGYLYIIWFRTRGSDTCRVGTGPRRCSGSPRTIAVGLCTRVCFSYSSSSCSFPLRPRTCSARARLVMRPVLQVCVCESLVCSAPATSKRIDSLPHPPPLFFVPCFCFAHFLSLVFWQENLDTDWPLYVRGHDGIARDIFIEVGSAAALDFGIGVELLLVQVAHLLL